MENKQKPHIAVEASNGLTLLLCDAGITTDILKARPALEKVVHQLQRDVMASSKDDREDGWQQVVGIDHILNMILLFATEGEADLRAEQESVTGEGGKK